MKAPWEIKGDKAPRLDGCGSQFLKDAQENVGKDVVVGVLELFKYGDMLREVNNTIITLVPKISHATNVGDYRSIAYCNILQILSYDLNQFLLA